MASGTRDSPPLSERLYVKTVSPQAYSKLTLLIQTLIE